MYCMQRKKCFLALLYLTGRDSLYNDRGEFIAIYYTSFQPHAQILKVNDLFFKKNLAAVKQTIIKYNIRAWY